MALQIFRHFAPEDFHRAGPKDGIRVALGKVGREGRREPFADGRDLGWRGQLQDVRRMIPRA